MTNKSQRFNDFAFTAWSRDQDNYESRPVKAAMRFDALNTSNHGWPGLARTFGDVGGNFSLDRIEIELSIKEPFQMGGFSWPYNFSTYDLLLPGSEFRNVLRIPMMKPTSGDTTDWEYNAIQALMPPRISETNLIARGTDAIARIAPTNPNVELASSLAELVGQRGKLFGIPGKQKNLSGEYLNYMLAISPVLSDVKDTYETAQVAEKLLKQYERDSGKLIRRRYEFPEVTTSNREERTNVHPTALEMHISSSYEVGLGTSIVHTKQSERTWFSGAFTYYLPQKGWRRTLSHWNRLYGVIPGAETVWNVIPFSFVADYFANMGSVLHNVDLLSRDGLVIPYAYVMNERKLEKTFRTTHGVVENGVGRKRTFEGKITYTSKRRLAASPFGFGIPSAGLNPRQVSILAALASSSRKR